MNQLFTTRKLPALMGIFAGFLAMIFAIVLMCTGSSAKIELPSDTGTRTSYSYYGGDAYTGMQQASADTARNVKLQSSIILAGFQSLPEMMPNNGFGFGTILLCLGLGMIAFFAGKFMEIDARADFEYRLLKAVNGAAPVESAPVSTAPVAAEQPAVEELPSVEAQPAPEAPAPAADESAD